MTAMRANAVRKTLREGGTAYGIMAAEFYTPGFTQIAANASFERPEFHAAVTTLLEACRKHKTAPGFVATTVEMARTWRAKGFRCLCYGTDVGVFQTALDNALRDLRSD